MNPVNVQERELSFPECPSTPNCVSSQASDPARRVDPLPVVNGPAMSMERLEELIRAMPRVTIVSSSTASIQAEFRSFLGFVDDVMLVFSEKEGVIHVRSASRTGKWDLGVNRRRVVKIRKRYLETE